MGVRLHGMVLFFTLYLGPGIRQGFVFKFCM